MTPEPRFLELAAFPATLTTPPQAVLLALIMRVTSRDWLREYNTADNEVFKPAPAGSGNTTEPLTNANTDSKSPPIWPGSRARACFGLGVTGGMGSSPERRCHPVTCQNNTRQTNHAIHIRMLDGLDMDGTPRRKTGIFHWSFPNGQFNLQLFLAIVR